MVHGTHPHVHFERNACCISVDPDISKCIRFLLDQVKDEVCQRKWRLFTFEDGPKRHLHSV